MKSDCQPKRQSNIELLRILAIIMIISFHYVYKGGFEFETFTLNKFIVKVFWLFGELGVNLFMLITGYFMINKAPSKVRLFYLWLQVWFYHILTALVANYLGFFQLQGLKEKIIFLFPIIFNRYWYVTVYFLICILAPYMNKFISALDQRSFQKFLITVLAVWTVIPTFAGFFFNSTESMLYYNRFLWFFVMYCIGAYERLYGIKFLAEKKKGLAIMTISFALMCGFIYVIEKNMLLFESLGTTESAYFWRPNNILMVALSVAMFSVFQKFKMKTSRLINTFATTTLGVYILHDGVLLRFLWNEVFQNKTHAGDKYLIVYILGAAFIIYLIGSVIDFIRQFLEKQILDRLLSEYGESKK